MKNRTRFVNRFIAAVVALLIAITPPPISGAQSPTPEGPGALPAQAPLTPQPAGAPVSLARAFSSGPNYDSGWVALALNQSMTLTHNLGGSTDSYVVDMQYRGAVEDGINHRYYGGADFGALPAPGHLADDRVGAYWRSLTTTSIIVYRRPEDTYAAQVRIRIWIDTSPDYASTWTTLAVNATQTFTHSLGGSVDDYVVDLQFKSAASGVNQRYYGGNDFGTRIEIGSVDDRVGVYWRTLTTTDMVVYRRPEDTYAEQVRIRIWVRPRPTYTSNWVTLNVNTVISLPHNIGGSVDDYQVVMDFKAPDANGINNHGYGGMDVGAETTVGNPNDRVGVYWRSLTTTNIVVYRRPEDAFAPQVRIRIFRFWKVPAPNYDSGWRSVAADGLLTLYHNLGGDATTYMVDMQYRDEAGDGINHRYYGGADFGTIPAPGHAVDHRVGAYWRTLTSTSIVVYRRPEDTYAPQVRIRIWMMPKPDYDSGWRALAAGGTESLTHNLDGNYQTDYLVYFDYRNTATADGINHRYYGGMDFGAVPPAGHVANENVGAYWRQLGATTVAINRCEEDVYAAEQRLRIWRIQPPAYNSGWVSLTVNTSVALAHNLGGAVEGYLVQMVQWDTNSENYLNQRYYGGVDFGNDPPTGYLENNRVGSYWRSLTNKDLTVYRRPEDGFADYVMVRIWNLQRIFLPVINK